MNKGQSPQKTMVKKFGGTSLGSLERIEHVAQRVIEDFQKNQEFPIIVASAMSGETNRLINLARQVAPEDRSPAYDMLLASGEQVSISLLAMALNRRGMAARPFLAYQLGFRTNALSSQASIESIDTQILKGALQNGVVPVVAGFQGVDDDDNVTTLGRGGSDTSAVAVAAALGHDQCEIYTDVKAIYTADPRWVPQASPLKDVCFEEMMEMASLGSKVLHARSVELATKYNVKIHLRSTFESCPGTWVTPLGENMEKPVVTAVTHEEKTAILEIDPAPGKGTFLGELFKKLASLGIIVDIISQSQSGGGQRLAFSVGSDDVSRALGVIQDFGIGDKNLKIQKSMGKVSVVGVGMQNQFGVAARFFQCLASVGIEIQLVTTSEIKISAVVNEENLKDAVLALHSEFALETLSK